MARIRTIKPEFPQSESMGRISREARLCFVLLWTIADDAGRLRGNSRMLASLLFPYDDDAPSLIDGWLVELEGEGCIVRYTSDGSSYLEVKNWTTHQKIDKPSTSKLPTFEKIREPSRTVVGGREGKGREGDQGKDQGEEVDAHPTLPTMAGAACLTMRAAGIASVNPSSPDLTALLAAGAEVGMFGHAAKAAVDRGKGNFAYVLAVVKGQMQDSQRIAANARASPAPQGRKDRQLETAALLTGTGPRHKKPLEVIDAETRILTA